MAITISCFALLSNNRKVMLMLLFILIPTLVIDITVITDVSVMLKLLVPTSFLVFTDKYYNCFIESACEDHSQTLLMYASVMPDIPVVKKMFPKS